MDNLILNIKAILVFIIVALAVIPYYWFKDLFSKVENVIAENKPKLKCESCEGTGYYIADNSEFQLRRYWCNCKMSYVKPPDNCHSIDFRWESCSHKIVLNHDQFDGFKPPHPDTIFEPYLKAYVIKSNVLFGRVRWIKELSHDGNVRWNFLGGFHDEVEYSDLIADIRDKKLKELGI